MQQDYGIPISSATDEELVAELSRRGSVACIVTLNDIRPLVDAEARCASLDEDASNRIAALGLLVMSGALNAAMHRSAQEFLARLWAQFRETVLAAAPRLVEEAKPVNGQRTPLN